MTGTMAAMKAMKATKKTAAAKAAPSMWEDFVQRHYVNKGHAIPDESQCAWQVAKCQFLGWPLPVPKQFGTELRLDEGHANEKARLDAFLEGAKSQRQREEQSPDPNHKPQPPNHQTPTTKPQPPNPNHQTTKPQPQNPNHQTPTTQCPPAV